MEKEDFVTCEQAYTLKELGFDLHAEYYYSRFTGLTRAAVPNNFNADCLILSAPTLVQVQKWLLKNKSKFVNYYFSIGDGAYEKDGYGFTITDIRSYKSVSNFITYDTPEEALSAGITECLKLLEQ